MPEAVRACSGGDICALVWWGVREDTGEPGRDGSPHPVGQGASVHGDGASSLMHVSEAATRFAPIEVWEAKNPWLIERLELAPDSGGPGRNRGGLGLDMAFRLLEDALADSTIERTKNAPWGLEGGGEARPNSGELRLPDGTVTPVAKATGARAAEGIRFVFHCGGGGGFGPPAERDGGVLADLREGYITEEHARAHYPHAFDDA